MTTVADWSGWSRDDFEREIERLTSCKPMTPDDEGWSEWVQPTMQRYLMQCCDCGLIHEMQFGALKKGASLPDGSWEGEELDPDVYRVEFRARRHDGTS